jgi:hypothetical protein
MAITINTGGTYKATRVSNADSNTGWAALTISGGGGGASLFAGGSVGTVDLVAEGTNAVATRTNKQRVKIYFTNATGYDFTAGGAGTGATKVPLGNAYIWAAFLSAGQVLTKASGGMQVSLGDGTNTSYWNVAGSDTYTGGFKKWAVNTGSTPSSNSGANATLGDITEIGFVTDVGGATTRYDNFAVDATEVGTGLSFQGTTVGDALFSEAVTQDLATAIGVLRLEEGIIFSQGSVAFSGTAMTSVGETLVFTDTLGGAYTYDFDVTGTVTLTNSSVSASGLVDYNFNTSSATSFTMSGGALTGFASLTTGAGQTTSGVVFSSGGTSAIANDAVGSTFNQCGLITLTGSLDACSVYSSTSASSITTSSLANLTGSDFISDGSNHAVELTSLGGGSMSWNSVTSGYDTGVSGEPVTATSTGNETIYVNVASGTLTINVEGGGTLPSIRSAGAVVNLVAGQSVLAFELSPAIVNYEYRIYTVTATGRLTGSVEVQGIENATQSNQSFTYEFTGSGVYAIQILPRANDYEESITYYSASSAAQNVIINLTKDINN